MQYRRTPVSVCIILALFAMSPATAQVVAHPNQISGSIELTNTNPDILAILDSSEGPASFILTARAVGDSNLSSTATIPASGPTLTPYELTVEAGPPGEGIAYQLFVDMRLDRDNYLFLPQITDPVVEEPAPDTVVDFSECVGVVDMRWVDESGAPVIVSSSDIFATSSGLGTQARQFSFLIQSQEYIAVRGDDSAYTIRIVYSHHVDGYEIRFIHEEDVTISCDEIHEMTIVVPGVSNLSRIVGNFDVVGETEIPLHRSRSRIDARSGPNLNYRWFFLDSAPGNGPYELNYLVPSSSVSPPQAWLVQANMILRDEPGRTQATRSKALQQFVGPGETIDLGDTLVMDPAYIQGDIVLQGPQSSSELASCVADLYRDFEDPSSPPRRTFPSNVLGSGTDLIAGAALPSTAGHAVADFVGAFDGVSRFEGDYEIVVPLTGNEPDYWRIPYFRLRFLDDATPEMPDTYQDSFLRIFELGENGTVMTPGLIHEQPLHYCFSQVNLTVHADGGSVFSPSLREVSRGEFHGTDFEDKEAHYRVDMAFGGGIPLSKGLPLDEASASNEGSLTLCLPQGSYSLRPSVQALNPGGGFSTTGLPTVQFDVGCGQVVDITTELQISLDPLPQCTADAELTVSGQVTSDTDVVRVDGAVGDQPPATFCIDCGEDPSYNGTLALDACDNDVEVTAEDFTGNTASVTDSVRFDGIGPALTSCQDILADFDPAIDGAVVDFELDGEDACDGSLPVTCDVASGSLFPEGSTEVSCSSVDSCGNESSCSFQVTVAPSCEPVEDPMTHGPGFWKRVCMGPHPSGEHENLDEYAPQVARAETFSDVDDADALCERLDPEPENDKCEQAEAHFMALLLNVASGGIAECNCIDDPDLGEGTVADAVAAIDAILSRPDRTSQECRQAQTLAARTHGGGSVRSCTADGA